MTLRLRVLIIGGYGTGTFINIQNLIGWWPLNGDANDYSGNNNNGVPAVSYTNQWTAGYTTPSH